MGACAAAVGEGANWRQAVDVVLRALPAEARDSQMAMVFASHQFRTWYPEMLATLIDQLQPVLLVGCSAGGVIGPGIESEDTGSISVLTIDAPGMELTPVRLTAAELESGEWRSLLPAAANGWLVLADPFTFDAEAFTTELATAFPETVIAGGLATGDPRSRGTQLFLNDRVHESGTVAVAVGGAFKLHAVVSQGAEPIGQAWTITGAEQNRVTTIGGRPALEVLTDTLRELPPDLQARASRNLLVGLAINEYRDSFRRGDFLIRNLLGVVRENGALAVGAYPREGQTLQFQIRDADAADLELRLMMRQAADDLAGSPPAAAVMYSCNGRGTGLFGTPNHDSGVLAQWFDKLPLTGFFCNGEIGPVGGSGKPFLHGFTASVAFFVPV